MPEYNGGAVHGSYNKSVARIAKVESSPVAFWRRQADVLF